MARSDKYTITEGTLTDIADAIREKSGTSATINPAYYANWISNIETPKTDNGKITDDVVLLDYDGVILHTYTAAEFLELSSLPALPQNTADISYFAWNWSLADAKSYVQAYGGIVIGATVAPYTLLTSVMVVDLTDQERLSPVITLKGDCDITIDWGDGTTQSTATLTTAGVDIPHTYAAPGQYKIKFRKSTASGKVYIYGDQTDGTKLFWAGSGNGGTPYYQSCVVSVRLSGKFFPDENAFRRLCRAEQISFVGCDGNTVPKYIYYDCHSLRCVILPDGVTNISNNCFNSCVALQRISLPRGLTKIENNALYDCRTLTRVDVPPTVSTLYSFAFYQLFSCKRLIIPEGITSIPASCILSTHALCSLTIPSTVTEIKNNNIKDAKSLRRLVFRPTTPPTIGGTAVFVGLPTDCVIHVPSGTLSDYTSAEDYPDPTVYTYTEDA